MVSSNLSTVTFGIFVPVLAIFVFLLSFFAYLVFRERELHCILNKTTGTVSYRQGGIWGSRYDTTNMEFAIAEITALEMKRHVGRYGDGFEIRLLLGKTEESKKRLKLSPRTLRFQECQNFATQIHQFLGGTIPLNAVD